MNEDERLLYGRMAKKYNNKMSVESLMEWDRVRLKLFPNAPRLDLKKFKDIEAKGHS